MAAAQQSHYQVALVRAVRTFVAAFLVLYPAPLIVGALSGTEPLDLALLRAAAVSGGIAVVSYLWRAFYDPSKLPSLKDADQPAPDGE